MALGMVSENILLEGLTQFHGFNPFHTDVIFHKTTHNKVRMIKGSQVVISKQNVVFQSLKIDFVLANSVNPDEMTHYATFHLGFHCLTKYPFMCFWSTMC